MPDLREQAILESSLEVFAAKGFERATMDEIAAKAKVAKGTLFYRYKSKEDLFLHLLKDAVERFTQSVTRACVEMPDGVAKLRKAIELQTRLSYEHPEFAKILLSEVWGKQERQRLFRETLNRYLHLLAEMIEQGIREGKLRRTDSALLSSAIFGMTAAATLHLLLAEQEAQIAATIGELQDYALRGILTESR
ncbi:Transcription regulator YcdC, C-terminal [Acididesulfobacillus acetoxydans]|uniref:Transcription regulator YcdC, C-terminal n=1 Tax=Acididesulfobacillus acetoxydans TaxID=1561005 RepID=A0A8S0Y0C1_9FIRM|nr:TetR/AcrR family transcriptional regulator [Acididesulfobacillus acetoxydans]CAA7603007.1 Transcription regulator YcdC, C-terminal [Acididesulfobacillus acetoxydans]CEJ05889.1 Transcriptional regulator, TetR [Acididesulfobacillus acetoxydans]